MLLFGISVGLILWSLDTARIDAGAAIAGMLLAFIAALVLLVNEAPQRSKEAAERVLSNPASVKTYGMCGPIVVHQRKEWRT